MAYITGIGMTKFGFERKSSQERVYECVNEALDDGDISIEQIDSVIAANMEPEHTEDRQRHIGPMLSSLFQRKIPILNSPSVCSGGGVALWNAINILNASNYKNILVVGFENIVSNTSEMVTDQILMGGERIYEQTEGLNFPAQNALIAQQYMMKYGATSDDLALVALKNHENAFDNPKAFFYSKKITLDMIKNSPVVASPLRLFDCCISCNGASAAIISKEKSDVEIAGSGVSTSNLSPFEREDMVVFNGTIESAKIAYKQAGISPKDVDFAEIHDAFTPLELISYEDLGFCNKGEGPKLIREGYTNINGKLPVNTSGGLKGKGHPISPTGLSQVYEIVKQMRRQAGKRQIDRTRIGLAQNIGGVGTILAVNILKNLN